MTIEDRYFRKYKKSQYEDYNSGKFFGGEIVNARYVEQENPEMKGNLLIEALPPIEEDEEIMENFMKIPYCFEEEREKDTIYRIQAINRLSDYMFPLYKNIEVERLVNSTIRKGYSSKFIMTPEYIKNLERHSACLTKEYIENNLKDTTCKSKIESNSLNGFMIMGISGGGKTTAINNTLSRIPQVIQHTGYGENKFLFTQITWLKIDCSYNGSLKGICQKVFSEIDNLLGTSYNKAYGDSRKGVDSMISAMSFLAQKYAIGALIIDELQHLNSRLGEDSLNFFVSLMNEIKMPVISIGTYKIAKMVLGRDFRHCRRITGIEGIEWTNIPKDEEWDLLVETLWECQWTRKKTELTQDIKDLLYEKTMGITDFIIKIFTACQIEAIVSGQEEITLNMIEKVAKKKFSLPSDMIRALRESDIEELSKLDDIMSPSIKEMLDNAIKLKDTKDMKEKRRNILNKKSSNLEQLKQRMFIEFSCFGYRESDKIYAIERAIKSLGADESLDNLLQETARILSSLNFESDGGGKVVASKVKTKITDKEAQEFVSKHTEKNPMV